MGVRGSARVLLVPQESEGGVGGGHVGQAFTEGEGKGGPGGGEGSYLSRPARSSGVMPANKLLQDANSASMSYIKTPAARQ